MNDVIIDFMLIFISKINYLLSIKENSILCKSSSSIRFETMSKTRAVSRCAKKKITYNYNIEELFIEWDGEIIVCIAGVVFAPIIRK